MKVPIICIANDRQAQKLKPLQPTKKPTGPKDPPAVMVTGAGDDERNGGVAAAAAALEKPKVEKEKRISTMNEAQIMEKLRSVVSQDDPKALYSKIRKVGQGCVCRCVFVSLEVNARARTVRQDTSTSRRCTQRGRRSRSRRWTCRTSRARS